MAKIDGFPVITEPSKERLNQRQVLDYEKHRTNLINWLLHLGKNPDRAEGYSTSTVTNTAYRLDSFYRWVWDEQTDGYTTEITTEY